MTFWSGETLSERLPDIFPNENEFDPEKIDCSAYTLTVGRESYITPDHKVQNPYRHTATKLDDGDSIAIPAGQFGFLLTEESIKMPADAMAFISMKAKMKFRGLINVSGFHVDPGYSGQLIFSVFNAGPKPLHIKRGDDLFLIWFANLDRVTNLIKNEPPITTISSELINGISGEIQSAHSFSDKLESLNRRLIRFTSAIGFLSAIAISLSSYALKDILWSGDSSTIQTVVEKSADEDIKVLRTNAISAYPQINSAHNKPKSEITFNHSIENKTNNADLSSSSN